MLGKIRGIKPQTWTDEKIVSLTPLARILFVGSWNFACDNGHVQDSPIQLKIRILPGDNCDINELLDEIIAAGLMERGDGYLTIPNLTDHQRPHKRWWKTCDKPGCNVPEGASSTPNNRGTTVAQPLHNGGTTVVTPSTTSPTTADVDGDVDGEGELTKARKRATQLPASWEPTDEHRKRATEYGLNLDREAVKFRTHAQEKGRTAKNWNAAFTRWLINAAEYAQRDGRSTQRPPQQQYTHDDLMQLPVEKRAALVAARTTGNLQ